MTLAKPITIKPEEQFARDYVDRLILEQLTEMEAVVKLGELADRLSSTGVGLATVKTLLASNPDRFAYHERRWIPSSRLLGQGRPFQEIARLVLRTYSAPMKRDLLIAEIGRIRRADTATVTATLDRFLERDSDFITSGDLVALTEWSFVANDELPDRALAINGVSAEAFAEARAKTESIDWRSEGAIAKAVELAAPVTAKTLGAVCWSRVNDPDPRSPLVFDAREFFARLLAVPGFVFAPGGMIHPTADVKKWVTVAGKLADRLAPTVEIEDAQPIEVKPEDGGRLVEKILANEDTVTATRLLEENYEITPLNKTFPDDLANVMAALNADERVVWVGGDRYRKTGTVPDFILEVPEPFRFQTTESRDEDGELIDIELNDDGLSSSLRKLLAHPLATDVLDEDFTPAPKTMPDNLRLVLKSIHRELGTFPMCQIPTNWLANDPKVQEMIWIDPAGRELQVWVNQEARLMYNLIDWWYEQPVESGAVFTLVKTPRPNVFEFAWLDQPDPVIYISTQRMEELRNLGLEAEGKSTLDLLIEVMHHWPKGADYLAILAELNVVRRSSRRLVASLLSSYQCFYQRSGSPVWHFDAKKVDQGFDKTKRKFVLKK